MISLPPPPRYARFPPGPAADAAQQRLRQSRTKAHSFANAGLVTVGPLTAEELTQWAAEGLVSPGLLVRNGSLPFYLPVADRVRPEEVADRWLWDAQCLLEVGRGLLREADRVHDVPSELTPRQLEVLRDIWDAATPDRAAERSSKARLASCMRQLHHAQALHAVFREPDLLLHVSSQLDDAAAAAQTMAGSRRGMGAGGAAHQQIDYRGTMTWEQFIWCFAPPALLKAQPNIHPDVLYAKCPALKVWPPYDPLPGGGAAAAAAAASAAAAARGGGRGGRDGRGGGATLSQPPPPPAPPAAAAGADDDFQGGRWRRSGTTVDDGGYLIPGDAIQAMRQQAPPQPAGGGPGGGKPGSRRSVMLPNHDVVGQLAREGSDRRQQQQQQ